MTVFISSGICQNRFWVLAGFHWFPSFRKLGNSETRKPRGSVYVIKSQLQYVKTMNLPMAGYEFVGMMISKMVYKEGMKAI